jgi:uncharacterized membrane protein
MQPATTQAPPPPATDDDRLGPGIVYGLYILSFLSVWFTAVIGVIVAYVMRDKAGPVARSHYDYLIATFWWSVPALLLALVLVAVGLPLSLILIGIPILMASAFVFLAWFLWFVVRCIVGAVYLARGEAHPRPDTLLA